MIESKSIEPERMGEWLRERGLHGEHIALWEQDGLAPVKWRGSYASLLGTAAGGLKPFREWIRMRL